MPYALFHSSIPSPNKFDEHSSNTLIHKHDHYASLIAAHTKIT